MRKTFLLVSLLVFLMLIIALPVMAESPKKIPVTLVTSGTSNSPPEKTWTTEGGIVHSQGAVRTGGATLTIDGQVPLVGTVTEDLGPSVINTKTGEMVGHALKCVFTFPGGSFEGVKITKATYENGKNVATEQHSVLQGSGVFEGCTLVLSQDWELTTPPMPKVYTGFLLTH